MQLATTSAPVPDLEPVSDILNETLITLLEAGRLSFMPRRVGSPTLWRWTHDGIKLRDGRKLKLECVRIGCRYFTSEQAMRRFIKACSDNTVETSRPVSPRTPRQRRRASDVAARELDKAGI